MVNYACINMALHSLYCGFILMFSNYP